jgi:hypothetical protein
MTTTEVVPATRKFRHEIPAAHRATLDTRILWLWNQRFGTAQMIWLHTTDEQDKLAATVCIQAIAGNDLNSISLLLRRLEGGATDDETTLDGVLQL